MIRLLLTSGRGPAECRIALAHALVVMQREAAAAGLDLDIAQGENRDGHGPASAIAVVSGDAANAQPFARRWTGSVQWIAQSTVRPHHKRKNWFIGVTELAPEPAQPALVASDVHFEAMRAGGPGGQHQNKTESAVRAVHRPTGLSVVARDGRSQHRNKALALARLAALLNAAGELAALTRRHEAHASHDQVQRGQPLRRFKGERFEAA
jgi:peptide chain release factor